MSLFSRCFRSKADHPLAAHVFRVVSADKQDMVLWSELRSGGAGMTWRGTMAEFRKTFCVVKAPTAG